MATMHRLQIALLEVDPPVWRRILVPSHYRLDQVALVLMTGMGWVGYHLYEFRIGENTYADPRGEDAPEDHLPSTALLGDVVAAGRRSASTTTSVTVGSTSSWSRTSLSVWRTRSRSAWAGKELAHQRMWEVRVGTRRC